VEGLEAQVRERSGQAARAPVALVPVPQALEEVQRLGHARGRLQPHRAEGLVQAQAAPHGRARGRAQGVEVGLRRGRRQRSQVDAVGRLRRAAQAQAGARGQLDDGRRQHRGARHDELVEAGATLEQRGAGRSLGCSGKVRTRQQRVVLDAQVVELRPARGVQQQGARG